MTSISNIKYPCLAGRQEISKTANNNLIQGSISILVLVFGVVFSVTIGGLVLVAATQYTASIRTEYFEKALTIAQAGADYYVWVLAHNPDDYTDGTGKPGPYIHEIDDPYGNTKGTYSLTVDPPASGSSIIQITSQGWENNHPEIKRTVIVRYGRPSLAKYAFLNNANAWYGYRATIHGPVFSNGGIRMDGSHDSSVQSAKANYTCGAETGCDPPEDKPGIWGVGGPQELWKFPVSSINFNNIVIDFVTMKTSAQSSGLYLPQSGYSGYHLTFNSDGTVSINKVLTTKNRKGWSVEEGCTNLNQEIWTQQYIGVYQVSQKPIIFVEDHVWVDGVVNGQTTVTAVRFPIDVNKMNIWINGNLTYLAKDGNSKLGLIAQNDIYFGYDIPTDFEIDAGLLAQKGRIIRHNYKYQGCSMLPKAVRQSLTIYGSLISNQKTYWSYGTGPNVGFGTDPTSGFVRREIFYDTGLYFGPPPYFPLQGDYEFISWEER